jgi:acetyltransferase-like isoleucine patch superfamily enzyme
LQQTIIDGIPENRFNPHCWITGEPEIGEDVWIGAFTLIDGLGGLKIGNCVNVSCGASILTHNTVKRTLTGRRYNHIDRKPTVIENNVFIGQNAVILMGCRIGHHSVIGAGAVVLEDTVIPPFSLVVGVPGLVVRNIENEIEEWAQEVLPEAGNPN